jgi:hypothetical protein
VRGDNNGDVAAGGNMGASAASLGGCDGAFCNPVDALTVSGDDFDRAWE